MKIQKILFIAKNYYLNFDTHPQSASFSGAGSQMDNLQKLVTYLDVLSWARHTEPHTYFQEYLSTPFLLNFIVLP